MSGDARRALDICRRASELAGDGVVCCGIMVNKEGWADVGPIGGFEANFRSAAGNDGVTGYHCH